MNTIKLLIVDDHPSVGEGTKTMIEQEKDFHVTIAFTGEEAFLLAQKQEFDLYIFDLHMPYINGLELTKRIVTRSPSAKILIYSGYDIIPHFNLLVEAGISGFVSKTSTREQLITALRCALRGEAILPIELFRQLRRAAFIPSTQNSSPAEHTLTEREQIILREISDGKSNKEIAYDFHLSQRTIEYSISNIFAKLGVNSRAEAVSMAKEMGLISKQILR